MTDLHRVHALRQGMLARGARAAKAATEESTALATVPDFANKAKAFEHYAAHVKGVRLGPTGAATVKTGGADMPEVSSFTEYTSAARAFMSGPGPGGGVLQGFRSGGDLLRFDPATGNLGILSPQGVIRTFFRPDDGLAYFLRQF